MGYYAVRLKMKDAKTIPTEWNDSIQALKELLEPDDLQFIKNEIDFIWRESWHDFMYDLVGHEQEFIKFYLFAKANMEISTDCWNVNDFEYGPESWAEFDKALEIAQREKRRRDEKG